MQNYETRSSATFSLCPNHQPIGLDECPISKDPQLFKEILGKNNLIFRAFFYIFNATSVARNIYVSKIKRQSLEHVT